MPNFTAKPPIFEARPFNGGTDSTLDIQGWLLASDIQSEHHDATGEEGEDNYTPEMIVFQGTKTISVGQWLMKINDEFIVMSASELYTKYAQV